MLNNQTSHLADSV